jgi:hypothetical protein
MKESCLNRDLLGALMALAAGPISRADRMSDEDHQVCVKWVQVVVQGYELGSGLGA